MSFASVRRDYRVSALDERRAGADPLRLFGRWLADALRAEMIEPNSMALATVDARGRPSVRFVLLKAFDARGFTFFTNYASRKGRDLAADPRAALTVWWPPLERQVRIEGRASRVSDAESDAYFAQRPRAAQLGAWASPQSRRVASRAELERRLADATRRFAGRDVPRPARWGGYRLAPRVIEFWQGRRGRLHDRLLYTNRRGGWTRERLAP